MLTGTPFRSLKRIWRSVRSRITAFRPPPAEALRAEKNFHDRLVTVDGAEFPYRVFVPPDWSNTRAWPVILALHGAGGCGSDGIRQTGEGLAPAIRRHPERFPALVVFPQSPANQPGWQGIGGQIALAALDAAIEEFNGDESRVTLTGLSIGGNGAWYLGFHHPHRFAKLLVVCGFVTERMGIMRPILYPSLVPGAADPSAAIAQGLAHIPTWIIHGDADETVPVEHSRRMAAALRALGAPIDYSELPGVGHNAWDPTYDRPDVVAWLLQRRFAAAAR
jgi:predicted peptidase